MTTKTTTLLIGLIIPVLFSACQQSPKIDLEKEKEALLREHEAQRDYHFNKRVHEFADQLSENFISVNGGSITKPTRQENMERWTAYFNAVEFEKWDDMRPPEIRFSDDASMAYMIVEKDVTLKSENDNGQLERSKTHFAWISIFRKVEGRWKIEAVASTNEPTELLGLVD